MPDSDSEDKRSKIFRTIFFPVAYIFNLFETILCKIFKKAKRHRGILHTWKGIILSSIMFSIVIFIILIIFLEFSFTGAITLLVLIGFLLGQSLHLLQDYDFAMKAGPGPAGLIYGLVGLLIVFIVRKIIF